MSHHIHRITHDVVNVVLLALKVRQVLNIAAIPSIVDVHIYICDSHKMDDIFVPHSKWMTCLMLRVTSMLQHATRTHTSSAAEGESAG